MRLILILTGLLAFQGAAASEFDELRNKAAAGDIDAQYKMGEIYGELAKPVIAYVNEVDILSLGRPEVYSAPEESVRNAAESSAWYLKAAEGGHLGSQYFLGTNGNAFWLLKAAKGGHADAQYEIGNNHLYGISIPQDQLLGAEWLGRAADNGSSSASLSLGQMYYAGKHGLQRDLDAAVKYFTAAHRQGKPYASYMLGEFYEKGNQDDPVKSKFWYNIYADILITKNISGISGNIYYELAQKLNLIAKSQADYGKLLKLYEKAAENMVKGSFVNLGRMHEAGQGTERDLVKALMWYKIASKRRSSEGRKYAQRLIKKLTNSDISKARSMAVKCRKSSYIGC